MEGEAGEVGHNLREKSWLRVDVLEIFIRKRGRKTANSEIEMLQIIKRRRRRPLIPHICHFFYTSKIFGE